MRILTKLLGIDSHEIFVNLMQKCTLRMSSLLAALAWLKLSYIIFNLKNNRLPNYFILLQNWIFYGRIGLQIQILLIQKNILIMLIVFLQLVNSFLFKKLSKKKNCLIYVNLQVLRQLFEVFFNLQIQKRIVVATITCRNTVLISG